MEFGFKPLGAMQRTVKCSELRREGGRDREREYLFANNNISLPVHKTAHITDIIIRIQSHRLVH